ncbi:MAG: polA [Candidatus Kaiserbacteria bacterium]|nr:polA [Candidatus Kaiserbacteria bacterium]
MAKKTDSKKEAKEKPHDVPGKPARLVLLDSHAILHRAYHALPDFTKGDGEPTGALYGLILMLLKIKDELKPDYIISARDLPGATHRHEIFEAYKAHRVQADDALIAQLKSAPKVFDAFGIPQYSLAGYEADDVLGTIVKNLGGRSDIETIIASGDMDTLQLVNDRVRVFTMRKGISDTVIYDPDAVRARYEFGPEHVVDYKALRGDPSDNIPGVKGIGEKTATELIKLFGSIENIYKELAKGPEALEKKGVKPRVIQLLLDGKSNAQFSKTLATIHCDVPIKFELPKRYWHMEEYTTTIEALLDDLEFRALKERLRPTLHSETKDEETLIQKVQEVDPNSLEETAVALWLLRSDTTTPSIDDILQYAHTEDFERAREFIFTKLRETGELMKVYETIERPLIPIIRRMNVDGVRVDVKYMQKLSKEYTEELAKIAARIYGHAGHEFNISSPKQLGVVLYDELKITPAKQKKTATGARTTREEELAKMSHLHPIIDDVLAYRELQKLLGTYIDKIPELVAKDGRLHANFLSAGTTTGRMASANPNLQNIPIRTDYGRRIRNAFSAEKGNAIVAIDYSQIELRIAAGLSGDEKLVQVFRDGRDVHTEVAAQVFNVPPEAVDREMRRRAKIINFGILYGMGVNALRANLGDSVSRDEAGTYIEEYFKNFSGVSRFVEKTKADAARQGFTETLFGRRRYFPGFQSSLPGLRAQAERMAVNAPIQGTQADIIKLAMIAADALVEEKGWRGDVRLLMQVHDELVFEVKAANAEEIARELRSVMEGVVDTARLSGVPIAAEASIGDNWGELKKIAR